MAVEGRAKAVEERATAVEGRAKAVAGTTCPAAFTAGSPRQRVATHIISDEEMAAYFGIEL